MYIIIVKFFFGGNILRIVVVGCGTAGASAAFAARMKNRNAHITVIGDEDQTTYSRCALPFALAGRIPLEKVVVFPEKQFSRAGIELIKPAVVCEIDTSKRRVRYRQGGSVKEVPYDTLVYATGGYVPVPQKEGIDLDGNFVLRTYDDAARLISIAKSKMRAVINGASFVALETAEALKHLNLQVHLIVRSRVLRSFLDEPLSTVVKNHLEKNGIVVHQGAEIERIEGEDRVARIVVGGERIDCDFVVHSTGTKPRIDLAKEAGFRIGETGGVWTRGNLATSFDGVYAAGDCAEVEESVAGKRVLIGLGTTAMRHGMVAGRNAAGGEEKATPTVKAAVMRLFGMEIGTVGLTETQAKAAGFNTATAQIKHPSLPHYWYENEDVTVRLVLERDSGRVLGAQVICERGAALRINMLSIVVERQMGVSDLAVADFCYSPPCADIWAPEAVCATSALRRITTKTKKTR